MRLGRAFWFPVAVGLAVINAAGAVYALYMSEPVHAFAHGALVAGFLLWARYLRSTSPRPERQAEKVEMLEANLSDLERQLSETQQRLDFADQLLKQRPKPD